MTEFFYTTASLAYLQYTLGHVIFP